MDLTFDDASYSRFLNEKRTDYNSKKIDTSMNAKIALCLFLNVLHYHTQKENIKLNITEKMINDIYYAFRFRDLSKEAIMILTESLIN
jgi:hypothetical protein